MAAVVASSQSVASGANGSQAGPPGLVCLLTVLRHTDHASIGYTEKEGWIFQGGAILLKII